VPDLFDLEPEQVMLVAAHEHDLQAAQKHGLRTAYIHRPFEHGPAKPSVFPANRRYDFLANDFVELANQLGLEFT
jgi:2-haloacid dehalogenase